MSAERRRLLLLTALLLVLGVVAGKELLQRTGAATGPSAPRRAGAAGPATAEKAPPQVVDLNLSALDAKPGHYTPGRDPFRFAAPPRPAAPPPPVPARDEAAERARAALLAQQRAAAAQAAQAAGPPRPLPPPVDVVYLGSFGPAGRPLAVFTDGDDIYNVWLGGVVKEKFIVQQVGYESVDLGFVGFPDAPATRLAVGG